LAAAPQLKGHYSIASIAFLAMSLQRALQNVHPHTRREPARLRQLDQTVAFAGSDLGDDGVRNVRQDQAIHDEAKNTRRPTRVPPAANDPQKQIAREKRRRDYDLTAVSLRWRGRALLRVDLACARVGTPSQPARDLS